MNQKVVLGSIIAGACVALFLLIPDQMISFVIAGHIPFTSISVPPLAMLALWIFVLPLSVLIYHLTSTALWKALDAIGVISQRHINRSIRWGMERYTLPLLLASVLVYVIADFPESPSSSPELIFRRRFLALPS